MGDNIARAERKQIFVAASIEVGASKNQVRIRNISETGALIEASVLPAIGAELTLARLDLEIGAVVVWSQSGRCGIKFDGSVNVDDWIAGKNGSRVATTAGQARIDAIQAAIRLGKAYDDSKHAQPIRSLTPMDAASLLNGMNGRIGEEISAAQRLIVAVAEDLSDDPLVLARHVTHLQSLQTVSEILDHLARIVSSKDPVAAIDTINLQGLRARLLGKSIF